MYERYKSPFGYQVGDNGIDSYGVDHRVFSLRDEIEYQTARDNRESQLMQMYNQQGITENYPQYTTNFWGDAGNNCGFGSSNISSAISAHPAMNTTPVPIISQASNLSEMNSFNDSYGGYSGAKNTALEEKPISQANLSTGFQAPKTSMADVFLEGVKGFGEGVLGATEYTINSLTNGGYDLLNDVYFNNGYEQRQNNLDQIVQQENLGKPLKYMRYYLDAVADSVPVGLGVGKLPKIMSRGYNKFRKIL